MTINLLIQNSARTISSIPSFSISLLIQRSPIVQQDKSTFEKTYQSYYYEVENELSRGPFKFSLGKLSAESSNSTFRSDEAGQISISEADNMAAKLSKEINNFSITNANRAPKEKLFLVTKTDSSDYWEFPQIDYTDGNFKTPLHKIAIGYAKSLFKGNEVNLYTPGTVPFKFQKLEKRIFYFRTEILPPTPNAIISFENRENFSYAWMSKQELLNSLRREESLAVLPCLVE